MTGVTVRDVGKGLHPALGLKPFTEVRPNMQDNFYLPIKKFEGFIPVPELRDPRIEQFWSNVNPGSTISVPVKRLQTREFFNIFF